MRKTTFQLLVVLISMTLILGLIMAAQLFATVDAPLLTYLPSIFKQAEGGSSDQPAGDDTPAEDDVYIGADFEIEGNLVIDGHKDTNIDWEEAFPPAELVPDWHSKRETDWTIFKPDGKFDKPESWIIQEGKVGPGQNELTNIMAWLIEGDGEHVDDWLVMGMERTKKEGTFFLDFELNQLPWDPSAGGLTRTDGDVVVGFELKGNPTDREQDLSVLIVQIYEEQPSSCEVTWGVGNTPAEVIVGTDPCPAYGNGGFYYRFLADGAILADSGLGEATMNDEPLPVPDGWNSYDSQGRPRDVIPAFQFAEAAINLKELDIELDCATFNSMHAKDRSSLEPNADLKDLAGPFVYPINCLINGHKFHDLDGDGAWDRDAEPGLGDWDIQIEKLDSGYTVKTTTKADGSYEFDWLESGAYRVSESCPAGRHWLQTRPGLTDFDGCGSKSYTVDINMQEREAAGNDFGNVDPALAVEKLCKPEVFLGEPIPYTITVKNTGSPVLTNISVGDTLLGDLGPIATLEPDASEILTATTIADTIGPITNTVTASKTFSSATTTDTVTISDTDTCVTVVHEPKVFNVFLAFEDKPNQEELPSGVRPNDYDYNDFVMNVEYEPTFLENENVSQVVFTMTQVADLSGASHEFSIKPDFTTNSEAPKCNGWYTRVGGRPEDENKNPAGDFEDGETEIFVSSDTSEKFRPSPAVIVTIEFTATPDGCMFDIAGVNSLIRENIHCQDCFFNPMLVSRRETEETEDQNWTTTITKNDLRMLSVPDPVYNWPAEHPAGCSSEEDCHVHIWECYPEVEEIQQGDKHPTPEFKPDWWETWVDDEPIRCPRRH